MAKKLFPFLVALLIFNSYFCFSQIAVSENNSKIASVQTYQKSNFLVYVFTPLTDFDEFRTPQRVERMNAITGDEAVVSYKNHKIKITVNPSKTKEENLDKLLLMLTRLHGYDSYVIKNNL